MFQELKVQYNNPVFILNVILLSIFFTCILIEGLSVTVSCLFKMYLKQHIYHFSLSLLCLWGSDVLLFSELINIISILFYDFIELLYTLLLYTFLVIWFARYKEYIVCLILFSKFSDILPTFPCATAISNL